MKDITVTFTQQEASALLQLIDLSVKSGGLAVAEAALVLTRKINNSSVNYDDDEVPVSEES